MLVRTREVWVLGASDQGPEQPRQITREGVDMWLGARATWFLYACVLTHHFDTSMGTLGLRSSVSGYGALVLLPTI